MDIDDLKQELKEKIAEDCRIEDSGIGYYEYGSIKAVDKQIGVEVDVSLVEIDISDFEIEDENGEIKVAETVEEMKANEAEKFDLTITKSGNGDPDACAESGKRRCGSCSACDSYDTEVTVTLQKIETKDGKRIAFYSVS